MHRFKTLAACEMLFFSLLSAVERTAVEYAQVLEQEAAPINPEHRPPSNNWPTEGEITVENLSVRYPSSDTDVLQWLTFRIPAKVWLKSECYIAHCAYIRFHSSRPS